MATDVTKIGRESIEIVADLKPFENLFYGQDKDDIASWTQILGGIGYKNEEKLCRIFREAYEKDKEGIIRRLESLSFAQNHAQIIADRIIDLRVYVPEVYPFTKSIAEWLCPTSELPPHGYVDVDETLNEAMQVIGEHLNSAKEKGNIRIPPLMISRMVRGGKTTLSLLLLRKLREANIHPIFINFDSEYKHREGLTQKQAILHSIVVKLTNPSDINGRTIICDEDALDDHIGDEPVVLIIDNLNGIGYPINVEAGTMLKKLFLDKPNRYLVITTHIPMPFEKEDSQFIESASSTILDCVPLSFRPTTDLHLLQRLVSKSDRPLTATEAMIYGGIPSLIYMVKRSWYSPYKYYQYVAKWLTFDEPHLFAFLKSVMDGKLPDTMNMFAPLGMVSRNSKGGGIIFWQLCYLKHILESFACELRELQSAISGILRSYEILRASPPTNVDSDKDWESIIQIAIQIRCILSKSNPEYSPFNLFSSPISKFILRYFYTLDEAKRLIENQLNTLTAADLPAVLIAIPREYSTFVVVDGIIAHCTSPNTIEYHGYKAKSGCDHSDTNIELPKWISKCFLLEGRPTETTDGLARDNRWKYCDKQSTVELLGHSFAPLCSALLSELYPSPSPLESSSSTSTATATATTSHST